jgi:hypothetical protein
MDVIRLGDVLDDYCTRCRLLTNHSVVAMLGEDVKKVRCRTCNHEHDYRQGQGGQKKKKTSAYEQVLASVLAGKEAQAPVPAVRRPSRSLTARKPGRPR